MTILDKIVEKKKQEVAEAKKKTSVIQLEESDLFDRECYQLRKFITAPDRTGIIAEFKRASPSKGIINNAATVEEVTSQYALHGASALSVLTDESFFHGSLRDLTKARQSNQIPILRKEFIIDEYQILEAKAYGADIILLIAAILTPDQIAQFGRLAKSLGMSVLLEVHNLEELQRSLSPHLDAIGVNNRNLKDFQVDVGHSYELAGHIPAEFLKISESGISNPQTIIELKKAGFDGFLIGENFMKESDPGQAIKAFVAQLPA